MARKHPPSFDFYPDDFVGGTLGMHPCARGIYITLLCHQWSHGSLNPTNIRQLVQITGAMPDELAEHLPEVLLKFEQRSETEFVNAKLEHIYGRAVAIIEKRRESGKAGASAKHLLEQVPDSCQSKQQANQEEEEEEEEVKEKKRIEFVLPFSSDEFIAAWNDFLKMRSEIKKPIKPTGGKATLKRLAEMGELRAIAAMEYTTANQWMGIREPETNASGSKPKTFTQQRVENTKQAIEDFVNG